MSIVLDSVEISDLEMIINGGFAPLTGFLSELSYQSVLDHSRLIDGTIWPVPIILTSINEHKIGDTIDLCLSDGTIVAKIIVESIFIIDTIDECQKVAGTTDPNHPYVQLVNKRKSNQAIGGNVIKIKDIKHYNYEDLRKTPAECRQLLSLHSVIVGFQTRNPLHRSHVELMVRSTQSVNGYLLLSPIVGPTQPGDIDADTRVRCYRHLLKYLPSNFCSLIVIPLAMRMLGPREALWHAIIRKNYGCTHFIVGRDHAGPSAVHSVTKEKFYKPLEAQQYTKLYENEIGIKIITSEEIVYLPDRQIYLPFNEVKSTDRIENISGTQLRQFLKTGQKIPDWFSYPEVINELQSTFNIKKGLCLYFIGLSGSGKTTLAHAIKERLHEKFSIPITFLDGDNVRTHLSSELGFSKNDRSINVRRIGYVASEIVKHGGLCICANIAPYQFDREYNRQLISQYGSYIEIFVNTPLEICESRDVKGLYKKAREGKIPLFTGISDPFESPINPEFIISYPSDIKTNIESIINYISPLLH